jgi:G3E family GTPase
MIPAFVLTGFLGSGKTTLLGQWLARPELSRTAVIINEFGEVGLDHDLVAAGAESFVQLQTGCLCCTIRGDLNLTLDDLLRRREAGSVPRFERIVIETSGLADPAPILQSLMADASTAQQVVLAQVVATVDAVNAEHTLRHHKESMKQIAVADRLILTKTDLLSGAPEALVSRLRALNPAAPVLVSERGRIDPAQVLDGSAWDLATKSLDVQRWLGEPPRDHTHSHAHDADRHVSSIGCYAIVRSEPVPAVALTLFLEALADHCGADLLRLKGIVNVAESPERPAVVHGVQHVFHPPAWLPRWPSQDRSTRLVFIVREIPREWVDKLLAAIEAEVCDVSATRPSGARDASL